MKDISYKQRSPRLVNLIRNYLVWMVIGVTGVIAVLGYWGLAEIYKTVNQNLEEAIRGRYNAEIQHIVETVAKTIESTVAGAIGPDLDRDRQEEVKRMIRGAKFDGRNGYFFLYDMKGQCIAHGLQRDKEGVTLLDLDEGSAHVVKQLRDKAEQGGGFFEYPWEKPDEQLGKFPKISYAKSLRGGQWWLGAGVYVDEIERTLQAEQEKQQYAKLVATGVAILFLCVVVTGAYKLSPHIAGQVTRPIDRLVEGVQRVSLGDYPHHVALANATEETQMLGNAFNQMQEKINAQVSALTTSRKEEQQLLARIRELTSNEWQKVEEDRRRMAGDLHDDIKQKLWILRTKFDLAQMADGPGARRVLLNEAVEVIGGMSHAINDVIQNLRPPALDELGLLPALRSLLEKQCELAGIAFVPHFQGEELHLSPHVEITIYRVVQEAMMNVIRHANAHQLDVWVMCNQRMLEVCLQDDGQGFDVEAAMQRAGKGRSLGLLNMKERVDSIGGAILFECPPTGGTTVTVTIHLSN